MNTQEAEDRKLAKWLINIDNCAYPDSPIESKYHENDIVQRLQDARKVQPRSEYHEDDGVVLWWTDDVWETHETPYMGTPNDIGVNGALSCGEEYRWWSKCPDFTPMVEERQMISWDIRWYEEKAELRREKGMDLE